MADSGEGGFGNCAACAIQNFTGDAESFQDIGIASCGIELLLGAEHLQSAACALFILQVKFVAYRSQTVAAVCSKAQHARFVFNIARLRTVH
jgi:hypothetical protein